MVSEELAADPDLRDYLQVVRRRKSLIILSAVVVLLIAVGLSYLQTPMYASTAKILLHPRDITSALSPGSQTNVDPARAVQTEIEVIKTEPVRNLVQADIGSAPDVDVAPVGQTDLVTIRAQSTHANQAAIIANSYAKAYIQFREKQSIDQLSSTMSQVQSKVSDLQKQLTDLDASLASAPVCVDTKTTPDACTQRDNTQQAVSARRTTLYTQLGVFQQQLSQLQLNSSLAGGDAQLITPASAAKAPFQPTPKRNAVLGVVLGLLIGLGLVFLVEYLADSIMGKDDLERAVPGIAALGLIPVVSDWKAREQSRLISVTDPKSPTAEAYRILRTAIQFIGLDRQVRVIQLTSASAREGKTTTLANLAVAFASSGLKTVAVCCDLRRPRLHEFFGLSNEVGFTSVLLGNVSLPRALQQVPGQERLLLLASGPLPPNPAELLSSPRTAELMRTLASQADVVLVDSPPVLPVTDALVLSQRADSVVLVTTAGATTRKAAHRAAEMLHQVNAPVVGAVLNGVTEESGYGGYSYRYYTTKHPVANGAVPASVGNGNGNGTGHRAKRRRRARSRVADE